MNAIRELLKKGIRKKPNVSVESETNSPIQINFGSGASAFSSSSKRPLVFAVILNIALTILGYRYIQQRSITEAASQPSITQTAKPPGGSNAAVEEPLEKQIAKARALFSNSRFDDSLAIYEKVLKRTPNDPQVLNDLGMLYLKKKKLQESEATLKQSVEIDPSCFVCLNNLGYLKTLKGEDAEAETYFKRSIRVNQDYLDPYFNLGVLYEKNGDLAQSANAYSEFLNRSKEQGSDFNLKLRQHIFSILEK